MSDYPELAATKVMRSSSRQPRGKLAAAEVHSLSAHAPHFTLLPEVADFTEVTPGAKLHDFELIAELGHGALGHVFLAAQSALANRLIVLKITPRTGQEHLSLARLQHTNIVPLYAVQDDTERHLRILCMPYFGNATLKQIMEELAGIPVSRRTGRDVLAALDRLQAQFPIEGLPEGTTRAFLAGAGYVEAVCWIGAALADALDYAHERGLVHLDLKPSNVLLSADAQPLLLDFHLAQPPWQAGGVSPAWLGGTFRYMAPEQRQALLDVTERRPMSVGVDGRADLYALGITLYEALGGQVPLHAGNPMPPLRGCNPQVSVGVADIIHKCLAPNQADRYSAAEALAADLRRHLENKPLRGVANHSLRERWQKWRRRRPWALALSLLVVGLVAALGVTALLGLDRVYKQRALAEEFFHKGRDLLQQRQYSAAHESLTRSLELAHGHGGNPALKEALDEHLRLTDRASTAHKLHQLADALRHFMLFPTNDQRTLIVLDVGCQQVWDKRDLLTDATPPLLEPLVERRLRRNLGDLAVGWADVKVRLAGPGRLPERCREALALLSAAKSWGINLPDLEWQRYEPATAASEPAGPAKTRPGSPRTGWEHYLWGRSLFRTGEYQAAAALLENGVRLEPADFYANFCLGVCLGKLERHARAAAAFSVCIGQDPLHTESFLQRGRSHAQSGDWQAALADFNRALLIRPNVPEVLLDRARARVHLGLRELAEQDLTLVLELRPADREALELRKKLSGE